MNIKVYWHHGFKCLRVEGEIVALVPSKFLSGSKVDAVVKVTHSDHNDIVKNMLVVKDVEDLRIDTF